MLADGPWARRWYWVADLDAMRINARRYPATHPAGVFQNYQPTTDRLAHPEEPELTGRAYRYQPPTMTGQEGEQAGSSRGAAPGTRCRLLGRLSSPGEPSGPLASLATMVDLNMPASLTDDQRVEWLREVGAALVRETGQPSGQVDCPGAEGGQPSWVMWWTNPEHAQEHDQDGVNPGV